MATHRYDEYYDEFYHSNEWKEVRQAVLERDHYLCQICKRHGVVRQATTVHHLIPLRTDYSKRLEMDNLETICQSCHNKEHNERSKRLSQKKLKNKIQKRNDIISFSANEDLL